MKTIILTKQAFAGLIFAIVATLQTSLAVAAAPSDTSPFTPGSGKWEPEANLFGLQNASMYVPKNTHPQTRGSGRALLVSLHGCGMTAANVINRGFNWEDVAEKYGMIVLAPTVPAGTNATRIYPTCWDWFGENHARNTRDEAVVLNIVAAIKARKELNIDPLQVYVVGLSSGAGLVNSLACVAPDVFAGDGAVAGPALYTAANSGVGSKAHMTPAAVAKICAELAGDQQAALATQLYSAAHGSNDIFVDITQSQVQTEAMKLVYSASQKSADTSDAKAITEAWKDEAGRQRVLFVKGIGLGHAWPAGAGGSGGGNFVNYESFNYPQTIVQYFFENNPRLSKK